MPNMTTCNHTTLDDLRMSWQGSLSRSYPPAAAMSDAQCRNVVVDGLPLPPEPGTDAGASADTGDGSDAGMAEGSGGGGCTTGGTGSAGVLGLLIALLRRRRA